MMIKKAIALLLVFCLSLGILTACGGSESKDTTADNSSTTATTSDQTTTSNEETSEPTEEDPFPGADLGGVTIKVAGLQNPETADEAKKEMWEERRKYVEEKFNCKIQFDCLEGVEWNDVPNAIITSIASGDPIIDIGDMSRYYISDLMTNDAILDITDTVKAYNLPEAYWKGGCQWAGKIVGFNRNPIFPWSAIVYNRDMIKTAGMEKTPGEMFKEGKWSLNDFYDYLKELKSKLPEGVNTFGIHALNWARGAAYANGVYMMDPDTYVPSYTSDGFYEIVEFFQKLVAEGLAVNATPVTRDDGTTGYDWNPAQAGFDEGKLALAHGDEWNFESYASKFDYGIVPFPWGSNVTIQNNDYTTLSDNYTNYVKDCGVFVVVKGSEKKATPKQYMDLVFSYCQDEAETLLKNREKAAKGEKILPSNAGTPRNFTSDLDIELWDWYISRTKFEPTDTTAQSNVFFRALYEVCATNKNARSAFEAVIGQDTYSLVEAGLVDESLLSPELKQKLDEYAATATPNE
ncbi:ABC transporter substrate-binding protein [Clostridium thermosuccinogenes]|uniref:ABC transporter substrate-binding protein n=1 Tax=Clostridium thermosuccinogenes TaxID=84032 RepID=UPI000CCC8447|nr:extracellular solute-binding protein [Pseudoclostridium thermosuccinogenes]PNT93478.1 hypothetical protein CDQ83_08240 [Pseudoclostridium thermosuccinogenes]